MSRRKLKKIKFVKDLCVVSGVIGFLMVATIPDDMPMDLFVIRILIGTAVVVLPFFSHRFLTGLERYKKSTREQHFHMYSLKNSIQE